MRELEQVLQDDGRDRRPNRASRPATTRPSAASPRITLSNRSSTRVRSARPSMSRTWAASTTPPPWAIAWSSIERPSRTEPSAARAISASASGEISTFSGLRDLGEMRDQHVHRHALEVEALAARQHRHRHLADLGGGEQELHVRRRLFQRLQQRVERLLRQHVHFVDDVDLVARRDRAIAHALDQLAHVVDAGAGGRVHLDHVDMAVLGDRLAIVANAAGIDGRAALAVGPDAVQRAGDDAGGRGLADAADAGEHEGMRDAAGGDGVAQRAHHGFLADQRGEIDGAVFAGEDAIGKGGCRLGGFSPATSCPVVALAMLLTRSNAPRPLSARRSSRPAARPADGARGGDG